jgi:PPK2 family polyphosphate:nucleotide phosphotransferase
MKKLEKLANAYRIDGSKHFRLKDHDPADTGSIPDKEHAEVDLEKSLVQIADLQNKFYAQDRWAILLIFQGMDASGKDGIIKHVMAGVNPQGCEVHSFRAPVGEELEHDYLWRCVLKLPQRRLIGIFNRSYYEEVLAVRVHPEYLKNGKLPPSLVTKDIWKQRFEDMCCFEKHLAHNGIVVRKFFLHMSREEQAQRLLARLDTPEKLWKASLGDVHEREHWDEYMDAFEDMIRHTSTQIAPWYVVPADHKWFSRLVVASALIETLESLNVQYPKLDAARRKELYEARMLLSQETAHERGRR